MSSSHQYPKPHPQTAGRVIDGEAIVVLSDANEVNILNGVASRIFELSDGSHSLSDIVDAIMAEYNVERAVAEKDVNRFVKELVGQEVLVIGEN